MSDCSTSAEWCNPFFNGVWLSAFLEQAIPDKTSFRKLRNSF